MWWVGELAPASVGVKLSFQLGRGTYRMWGSLLRPQWGSNPLPASPPRVVIDPILEVPIWSPGQTPSLPDTFGIMGKWG